MGALDEGRDRARLARIHRRVQSREPVVRPLLQEVHAVVPEELDDQLVMPVRGSR